MKKSALTLLGVFALSQLAVAQTTPAAAPAAMIPSTLQPATILVVDIGAVFNQYTLAVANNLKFQGAFENANSTYNSMSNDAMAIAKDYQDIANKLSAADVTSADKAKYTKELDEKKAEFQIAQTQLNTYKSNEESALSDYRLKITQALLEQVRIAVNTVAKKHNAMFVLNSNGVNSVLYSNVNYDATQEVANVANANANAVQLPAPPPSVAPTAKPAATAGTSAAK